MPELTRAMMAYLKQFHTPIFIDCGGSGEGWGSGSFIELNGRKFILTNEHVAKPRRRSVQLGFRLNEQDQLPRILGDHAEKAWPWDLALLPVRNETWLSLEHSSTAIQEEQIALAHTPFPTEVFAFAGYAGERTTFIFKEMQFRATTSLAREVVLAPQTEINHQFHFGLAYLPDQASTVVGHHGLPSPPGLSGSTVWNTCFVEAKAQRVAWTPESAKVAGVVWGWPSGQGVVVATKAEHVRSFLLSAAAKLT